MRSKTSIFNYVSAEGPFLLQLAGFAAAGSYTRLTRCYNRGLDVLDTPDANDLELYDEYVPRDVIYFCCFSSCYFPAMQSSDPRFASTSSIGSDPYVNISLATTMILHCHLDACGHLVLLCTKMLIYFQICRTFTCYGSHTSASYTTDCCLSMHRCLDVHVCAWIYG
jgi:hypothetical protein